ncbi:MAG: hypothetical protein KGL35_10850, partial [Bradyrhizobium sp.]|nr:hypothetical protein [Bradyrhizobium sp.]
MESAAIALDARRAQRLMIDGADVDAWDEAHQDDYAKIRPVMDFRTDIARFFEGGESAKGLTLPWNKTHGNFRIRSGEVTLWHGINGHGKSLVLNHVMASLM